MKSSDPILDLTRALFGGAIGGYISSAHMQAACQQANIAQYQMLKEQYERNVKAKSDAPDKWGDFEDAEIIENSRALEHK